MLANASRGRPRRLGRSQRPCSARHARSGLELLRPAFSRRNERACASAGLEMVPRARARDPDIWAGCQDLAWTAPSGDTWRARRLQ